MPEETRIIEKIRELKNTPNKQKFLADFRLELASYVLAHPAKDESRGFWNIKWLNIPLRAPFPYGTGYFQKAAGVAMIIVILGTSGVAFASQNSLPGNTLYPVKLLTEDIRSSLAISPEAKAKLQTDFAARRVAEVKTMLEKNSADPRALETATNQLRQNASNAVNIIDAEKKKGTDVSGLAKNISDNFNQSRQALDSILKEQKNNLEKQTEDTQTQITAAGRTGNTEAAESLSSHLGELTKRSEIMTTNLSASEELLKEKATHIANSIDSGDKKTDAEKTAEKTPAPALSVSPSPLPSGRHKKEENRRSGENNNSVANENKDPLPTPEPKPAPSPSVSPSPLPAPSNESGNNENRRSGENNNPAPLLSPAHSPAPSPTPSPAPSSEISPATTPSPAPSSEISPATTPSLAPYSRQRNEETD